MVLLPENLLYLYWHGDHDYASLGTVKGFEEFPEFDQAIQFWLNFWKEQGLPFPKDLDPFLIKVLIAKESSFRTHIKTKIAGSSATGLMQVLQSTLYRLEGIPINKYVEVKGHFLELRLDNLTDPVINMAAGIRWLSHKYYLLQAGKKSKPDDVYAMIKYYHSWDKDGENYANDIFKMYHESNNSIPYRK
ncbi:MAG: transglycosylase SLT domain-containing protein [Bdellovibrionales bacterium]|nr:transglycosylase SLT domain-containing protein [Bdellovibrionales bacterium]